MKTYNGEKRWVDGDLMEGGLCSFISWEVSRKKIRKGKIKKKLKMRVTIRGKYAVCVLYRLSYR